MMNFKAKIIFSFADYLPGFLQQLRLVQLKFLYA
jgi:hypothetical protein